MAWASERLAHFDLAHEYLQDGASHPLWPDSATIVVAGNAGQFMAPDRLKRKRPAERENALLLRKTVRLDKTRGEGKQRKVAPS